MRAGLMLLIVMVAAVIIASPIRADEFIDLYKAARTVADVEAANGKVREEVQRVQSIAADVARLHVAKMTACGDVEASDLDATAAKAQAFSITLARIDTELLKSLAAMRQKIAASTRARDDVNRFTVAAHEFGRLNVQTQEIAKAIKGVARNIRSAAVSCLPTSIPPLFADDSTPRSRVVSTSRPPTAPSRPPPRRRPPAARPLFPYF